jgi:hypothetical protein
MTSFPVPLFPVIKTVVLSPGSGRKR